MTRKKSRRRQILTCPKSPRCSKSPRRSSGPTRKLYNSPETNPRRQRRWTAEDIGRLEIMLMIAVNPVSNSDWAYIAKFVGSKYTAEECHEQAFKLGWEPPSLDPKDRNTHLYKKDVDFFAYRDLDKNSDLEIFDLNDSLLRLFAKENIGTGSRSMRKPFIMEMDDQSDTDFSHDDSSYLTSTPQVIDFCCAKDGMARSKLPSIAPHNEKELRKMLAKKEKVGQDIVELEDEKRKFSNAYVEAMMKELEKVIPEVLFISYRCP
ncbi:hypothetical protein DdX_04584 [Ditylenchus destructor]|uniref:Myb-like domain-containing protein n=1 Tax=Ditylenchus destructor TaxID=166010 RepID=A0AAD4RB86_9BILA|nr:hypothetical protein DdX_04584 [Ditylenchus destructor]